jgi:hypothetical protein
MSEKILSCPDTIWDRKKRKKPYKNIHITHIYSFLSLCPKRVILQTYRCVGIPLGQEDRRTGDGKSFIFLGFRRKLVSGLLVSCPDVLSVQAQ